MATASDIREIVGRAAASLGYSKLKPEQEQAILTFVSGKDVFVALPTGYGKLLCFAAPCVQLAERSRETVGSHRCVTLSCAYERASCLLLLKGNLCCVHQ